MTKRVVAVFLAVIWFGATVTVLGGQTGARATGFFSDMHWVEEAGDVVGMEVLIVYSTNGLSGQHWAYVQVAEGVPSVPSLVKAAVAGDRIEFTIPEGRFVGRVTEKALVGKFDGSAEQIRLPRRKSYWQ